MRYTHPLEAEAAAVFFHIHLLHIDCLFVIE